MSSNPKRFLKAAGYVPGSSFPHQYPEPGQAESSSKKSTAWTNIEEPSAEPREESTSHRPKKKGRMNDALPDSSDEDLEYMFRAAGRIPPGVPLDASVFSLSPNSCFKMSESIMDPEVQAKLYDVVPHQALKEASRSNLIVNHLTFPPYSQLEMEQKKVENLEADAKEASKLIEIYKKEILKACGDPDKVRDQFKGKPAKLVKIMHKSYSRKKKLKKLAEDLAAARIDAYERGRAAGEASLEPLKKKQRLEVVQDFIKSPVFERLCDRKVGTEVVTAFFKSVKQCQKLKDLPTDFDFTKLNIALDENLEPYPNEDGDEYEVDLSSHEFGSLLDTSDPNREKVEIDKDA